MTTLAGSGFSGNADGPAGAATFVEPFGIAIAKDGTIYVSDMGGQRIRALRGNVVSTIAGGGEPPAGSERVPGGFRDGPGSAARFNRPMGLALLPDGTLLVADAWNHVIRALRDGMVTTFAGNPERAGSQDGSLKDATFREPRGLAVDGRGNVFVADRGINGVGGGLRKITPAGVVSTIALPAVAQSTLIAVAIAPGDGTRLYLADLAGLVQIDETTPSNFKAYRGTAEGGRPFGFPDSLVAADDGVVFTDTRTHAVRLFRAQLSDGGAASSQPLNPPRPADAEDNGGGFRDGPMAGALFDAPRGIARDSSGDLIVCDSGNRRIRRIASPDIAAPLSPGASPGRASIILGGAPLFYDTLWSASIAGRYRDLSGRPIEAVQYDDTSAQSITRSLSAIENSRATGAIWLLSTRDLDALGEEGLRAALADFSKLPGGASLALLPLSGELAGAIQYANFPVGDPSMDPQDGPRRFHRLTEIANQSRVPTLDLSKSLRQYAATNAQGAPYAVLTPYLTAAGRDVVARALASGDSVR